MLLELIEPLIPATRKRKTNKSFQEIFLKYETETFQHSY